jgi:CelD/BcsL family acetyltransferase involved in cellulose biosynthesis
MSHKTIRTLEGLDSVRADWHRWQPHISSDLGQFELICGLRPEVECPLVTVVEQDGKPCALLAGRLEHSGVTPAIGHLRPFTVPARVWFALHEGAMGRLDAGTASEMVAHVRGQLAAGVADAAHFSYLPEHSPLLDALLHEGSRWLCDRTPRWATHREMTMPTDGTVMDRKLSAKARWRIRRKQKGLEAAFPGKVRWHYLSEFDDVSALCARIERVAAIAYQRGLGVGFFDNEEFRSRYALFATRGQLRVQLLEIDGEVRAFWCGIIHHGTFHSSTTAYDPALSEHVVGTQNFLHLADGLMREGVQRFDFGLGDAKYKETFGDRAWRETSIWMFAPTFKGACLMALVKSSSVLDVAARRLVERAGLTDKLRSLWRRGSARESLTTTAEAKA